MFMDVPGGGDAVSADDVALQPSKEQEGTRWVRTSGPY